MVKIIKIISVSILISSVAVLFYDIDIKVTIANIYKCKISTDKDPSNFYSNKSFKAFSNFPFEKIRGGDDGEGAVG